MNEKSHRRHPNTSNILYVDLNKLAKVDSQAGELASVLVGAESDPKDEVVQEILYSLKQSFKEFKDSTEVKNIMTRAEELIEKGEIKGEAKGIIKGKTETALNMLQAGLPVGKIAEYVEMPIKWVDSLVN